MKLISSDERRTTVKDVDKIPTIMRTSRKVGRDCLETSVRSDTVPNNRGPNWKRTAFLEFLPLKGMLSLGSYRGAKRHLCVPAANK